MTTLKNKGINYSNYILEAINNYYADEKRIYVDVETFYNCREQGYVLGFHSEEEYFKNLNIWVYAQRNSDEPTLSWGKEKNHDNMFTEEIYTNTTQTFDSVEKAVNVAIDLVNSFYNLK